MWTLIAAGYFLGMNNSGVNAFYGFTVRDRKDRFFNLFFGIVRQYIHCIKI